MTPALDVVVPVHNQWQLTEKCLTSLRAQTVPHTVVVADNGSTDATPRRLAESFPEARMVATGVNLGFSIACNRGVEAGEGNIVVLLNNDVECHRPDFLESLTAPLVDGAVGSVAALLLEPRSGRIESLGLAVDRTRAG